MKGNRPRIKSKVEVRMFKKKGRDMRYAISQRIGALFMVTFSHRKQIGSLVQVKLRSKESAETSQTLLRTYS